MSRLAPQFDPTDVSGTIPLEQQIAVCQAILRDPRESLGLELASHLPLESTGLWGFLLRSSATFGEMLARARRYQRIVNVFEEFSLEERGGNVAMVCDHPDPSPFGPREQVVIWLLGHWLVWGRQLTGHPMPVASACFRWHGPEDSTPFERFFGGPVTFGGSRDALIIPKAYLALPCRDSAPELGKAFEAYASRMVSNLAAFEDPLMKVKTAIAEGLPTGASGEMDVAAKLGLTPRTLHRRLSAAGTSFRQLKHRVMLERAEELLGSAEVPLSEVSFLLGFSEPSSFHRAIRRWKGITPGEWRMERIRSRAEDPRAT